MASYQTRKSTAPEPPPLSQLWQIASNNNGSYLHSDEQVIDMVLPPLHATHAITNQYHHSFDEIIRNNPYQNKNKTKNKNKNRIFRPSNTRKQRVKPINTKKRIIRPINANANSNGNHTITNMKHHRKESKNIDTFLKHRMTESELKNRHILVETNTKSTKQKEKEKIKSNLNRKLSNKFRPKQNELYDRGIYITDPKDNPQNAAWNHANQRRRNSQILAQKFNSRPHPNDVLNKGIITKEDYFEIFNVLPQTQPPSPSTPILNDIKERNKELHRRRASKLLQKFLLKRPKPETIKKRHKKVWITQGQLCTSKRRESQTIHDFLLTRPNANKLVSKHILPSEYVQSNHINYDFKTAKQNYIKRRKQSRSDLEKHLLHRPPLFKLNRAIIDPNDPFHKKKETLKANAKNSLNEKFQSRPEIDQVPYRYLHKSRASLVLEQFLPVRPEIQQLWDKNILPSLPPSPHKLQKTTTKQPSTKQFKFNIDKRSSILQIKLSERAPRESLLELGILKMSPAPSPPPLSVMKHQQKRNRASLVLNQYLKNKNDLPHRVMKSKYKELIKTEIELRHKLESIQSESESLSTELIHKNSEIGEQQKEFEQRLNRLKLEYEEQYLRQQKTIEMSNESQIKLRKEIETLQDTDNLNLKETLKHDKEYISWLMDKNKNKNNINIKQLLLIEDRINNIESNYESDLERERRMHRKFNEQSERVKQTLVDEINKMEIQHQSKLLNLENQIVELKQKNRQLIREKHTEINNLKNKLHSEIDKERNIATIMVEDLDEEKTRLIQEMNQIKKEYHKKLAIQKQQINQLRQVAEDAVFYGNKAINAQNSKTMIHELETKLNEKQNEYNILKKNKENLEKKVLYLTQQILDTFSNNLNDDLKKQLNLISID